MPANRTSEFLTLQGRPEGSGGGWGDRRAPTPKHKPLTFQGRTYATQKAYNDAVSQWKMNRMRQGYWIGEDMGLIGLGGDLYQFKPRFRNMSPAWKKNIIARVQNPRLSSYMRYQTKRTYLMGVGPESLGQTLEKFRMKRAFKAVAKVAKKVTKTVVKVAKKVPAAAKVGGATLFSMTAGMVSPEMAGQTSRMFGLSPGQQKSVGLASKIGGGLLMAGAAFVGGGSVMGAMGKGASGGLSNFLGSGMGKGLLQKGGSALIKDKAKGMLFKVAQDKLGNLVAQQFSRSQVTQEEWDSTPDDTPIPMPPMENEGQAAPFVAGSGSLMPGGQEAQPFQYGQTRAMQTYSPPNMGEDNTTPMVEAQRDEADMRSLIAMRQANPEADMSTFVSLRGIIERGKKRIRRSA
jgi:hypothetical protein